VTRGISIITPFWLYAGMGIMRVLRRVDLKVEPRNRIVSVSVTAFILAAATLGFFVAASYFR
jgi:hypothetical protein